MSRKQNFYLDMETKPTNASKLLSVSY